LVEVACANAIAHARNTHFFVNAVPYRSIGHLALLIDGLSWMPPSKNGMNNSRFFVAMIGPTRYYQAVAKIYPL